MYMKKYPCVYMRGGTSKAVFFHEKDLPEDKSLWDDIFLKVMGTPDVKQIDGMGGTVSSTSKIAIRIAATATIPTTKPVRELDLRAVLAAAATVGVPHTPQNLAPSLISAPHCLQCMIGSFLVTPFLDDHKIRFVVYPI